MDWRLRGVVIKVVCECAPIKQLALIAAGA